MTEEYGGSVITNDEPIKQFDTGAVRSDLGQVRYDLLHPKAMHRLAETFGEGAAKYGDYNWLKGMPLTQVFNHLIKHVFQYLEGDRSEDHLAHFVWGGCAAMVFEDTENDDLYYSPRNVKARIEAEALAAIAVAEASRGAWGQEGACEDCCDEEEERVKILCERLSETLTDQQFRTDVRDDHVRDQIRAQAIDQLIDWGFDRECIESEYSYHLAFLSRTGWKPSL